MGSPSRRKREELSPLVKGMRGKLAGYGDDAFSIFLRKVFIKAMGYSDSALDRPIIGITNTYSGYNPCHRTVPEIVSAVKRGVMLAGGLPVEFPVISMHEAFSNPTSMYLRNLMSMDVEEMVRGQPMDSVVLIGGCDKTVPALLMGAASADVPAIMTVTGPMLTGSFKGERVGACTDCRRFWAQYRAGDVSTADIEDLTSRLAATAGTCAVMGTASTMALVSEALGMMLPGSATIPAVYAERLQLAELTGARAVEIARQGVRPSKMITASAIRNAMHIIHAVGGSSNAVIHLAAIAGRLGIKFDLEEFDQIGRKVPVVVDLKPSGEHYMEDLHKAGGMISVCREIKDMLDLDVLCADGKRLADVIFDAPSWEQNIVKSPSSAAGERGAIRVLRGNLAPGGAILKHSAASPDLMRHEGKAVVFDSLEDLNLRIDSPDLEIAPTDVLILRNAGPVGAPGMPEAGYIPIPKKLSAQGIKDMVRISDARMSGTAFGTIILHITPEASVGGPLALVENGDQIRLDVPAGRLDLLVSDEILAQRRSTLRQKDVPEPSRGYRRLFVNHVMQAEFGCDFDFLRSPMPKSDP